VPLQEFTAVRARARDRAPHLGLQRNGRVSLSVGAMEALNEPTHVVLLFDPDPREFGIRRAEPDESHAYKVRHDNINAGGNNVSALALWRFYDIDFEQYLGNYPARIEDGVLIIHLMPNPDGAGTPVVSTAARRSGDEPTHSR